jgi:aminopeptidase N
MIEVHSGPGDATLTQSRFGLDAADQAPRRWRTPVFLGPGEVQAKPNEIVDTIFTGNVVSVDKPWTLGGVYSGQVVNEGGPRGNQLGYFRTLYDAAAFAKIAEEYPKLSAEDQLGILNDTGSEALAGYAPMGDFLQLTTRLPLDANPVVAAALVGRLSGLDRFYEGLPSQARFRAFAISRLHPMLARLGWTAKPGEPPNTESLRTAVLAVLGRLGDADVIADAKTRFKALAGGATLPPAERQAVLSIVAINADAATWDQLHTLAKAAKTDLEKREYYNLLGRVRDEALAKQALALALSGEPAPTTAPGIIRAVGGLHPALALAFIDANWAKVSPLLDPSSLGSYAPGIVAGAADPALIAALDRFAQAHIAPTGRGDFAKVEATLAYNAKVRAERLPQVDAWLAQAGR